MGNLWSNKVTGLEVDSTSTFSDSVFIPATALTVSETTLDVIPGFDYAITRRMRNSESNRIKFSVPATPDFPTYVRYLIELVGVNDGVQGTNFTFTVNFFDPTNPSIIVNPLTTVFQYTLPASTATNELFKIPLAFDIPSITFDKTYSAPFVIRKQSDRSGINDIFHLLGVNVKWNTTTLGDDV